MNTVPLPFTCPVRGTSFHPDSVDRVREGMEVVILRDRENPWDANACKVIVADEAIGYLPKELSARLVLREEENWKGTVSEVIRGDKGVGVRVQVSSGQGEKTKAEKAKVQEETEIAEEDPDTIQEVSTLVRTRSGRTLGRLKNQTATEVVVLTDAGQAVTYPKTLVVIEEMSKV